MTTTHRRRDHGRPRRGAALVVALVTIAVLASVTAIASSRARQAAAVVDNRRSQVTARAMAESGVLAARARIESALRDAGSESGPDSARVHRVFDALTNGNGALAQDTISEGAFATTVVDISARLDVNTAGAEGLQQLLATVAPPDDARRLAQSIEDRVRGDTSRVMQPFTSLDELLTVPGMQAAWLDAIAADLTVDGDGRVNRRAASRRVLAAATGTLVDRPSRLLLISRGWRLGHLLTREIQAVFAVNGTELRLVRWREQDR